MDWLCGGDMADKEVVGHVLAVGAAYAFAEHELALREEEAKRIAAREGARVLSAANKRVMAATTPVDLAQFPAWIVEAYANVRTAVATGRVCPGKAVLKCASGNRPPTYDNSLSEAHAYFWDWSNGEPYRTAGGVRFGDFTRYDLFYLCETLSARCKRRMEAMHLVSHVEVDGVATYGADFSSNFRNAVRDCVSPRFLAERLPAPDADALLPDARSYQPFLVNSSGALIGYDEAPKNAFGVPIHSALACFEKIVRTFGDMELAVQRNMVRQTRKRLGEPSAASASASTRSVTATLTHVRLCNTCRQHQPARTLPDLANCTPTHLAQATNSLYNDFSDAGTDADS